VPPAQRVTRVDTSENPAADDVVQAMVAMTESVQAMAQRGGAMPRVVTLFRVASGIDVELEAPLPPPVIVCSHERELYARYTEGVADNGCQLARTFFCPITHEPFRDPVVASDGHTYERAYIERHMHGLRRQHIPVTSPMTNQPLASRCLYPANNTVAAMRACIENGLGVADEAALAVIIDELQLDPKQSYAREAPEPPPPPSGCRGCDCAAAPRATPDDAADDDDPMPQVMPTLAEQEPFVNNTAEAMPPGSPPDRRATAPVAPDAPARPPPPARERRWRNVAVHRHESSS